MQKNPDWYLTQGVSEEIDTTGGVITSNDNQLPSQFLRQPSVKTPPLLSSRSLLPVKLPGIYLSFQLNFLMETTDDSGTPLETFTFESPVTISLSYQDEDIVDIREDTILLYYWDTAEQVWKDAATTCTPQSSYTRDLDNNTLSVDICHFTEFSLLGEDYISYTCR